MSGINELERKWREEAREDVPEEYASRGLHEKYLRGDNSAAGLNDAADYLEDLAHEAWKPVSEPPTAEDGDAPQGGGDVIARWEDGLVSTENWNDIAERAFGGIEEWARIRDVVLMPPQGGE